MCFRSLFTEVFFEVLEIIEKEWVKLIVEWAIILIL